MRPDESLKYVKAFVWKVQIQGHLYLVNLQPHRGLVNRVENPENAGTVQQNVESLVGTFLETLTPM